MKYLIHLFHQVNILIFQGLHYTHKSLKLNYIILKSMLYWYKDYQGILLKFKPKIWNISQYIFIKEWKECKNLYLNQIHQLQLKHQKPHIFFCYMEYKVNKFHWYHNQRIFQRKNNLPDGNYQRFNFYKYQVILYL